MRSVALTCLLSLCGATGIGSVSPPHIDRSAPIIEERVAPKNNLFIYYTCDPGPDTFLYRINEREILNRVKTLYHDAGIEIHFMNYPPQTNLTTNRATMRVMGGIDYVLAMVPYSSGAEGAGNTDFSYRTVVIKATHNQDALRGAPSKYIVKAVNTISHEIAHLMGLGHIENSTQGIPNLMERNARREAQYSETIATLEDWQLRHMRAFISATQR